MISDKVICQYGNAQEPNYIFYKQQFVGQLNNGVKEQRSNSALMDGSQRLNGAKRNKRAGYLFQYDFKNPFNAIFNVDFINRVFFDKPKLCFWYQYQYFQDNKTYYRNLDKWFYNIADCTIPPAIKEKPLANKAVPDNTYTVGLTLEKPYLYDCSADIQYVSLSDYNAGATIWGAFNWGEANWGSSFTPINISTLTPAQKQQFFVDLDMSNLNYFVFLRDRFFQRDTDYSGSYNYVINETLTDSSFIDVLTTDAFQDSPADNRIYRIEISQLQPDQVITIQNLDNDSGLQITWLDSVASPTSLTYNSYYNKIYSGATEIDVAANKYRIEAIDSEPLYFSGLLNPRPFQTTTNETIRITNNQSSTPTLKIDNLMTY
jgi:hypothetical protein